MLLAIFIVVLAFWAISLFSSFPLLWFVFLGMVTISLLGSIASPSLTVVPRVRKVVAVLVALGYLVGGLGISYFLFPYSLGLMAFMIMFVLYLFFFGSSSEKNNTLAFSSQQREESEHSDR